MFLRGTNSLTKASSQYIIAPKTTVTLPIPSPFHVVCMRFIIPIYQHYHYKIDLAAHPLPTSLRHK